MIDITKEFNDNKDNWVAEILWEDQMREKFPDEMLQISINETAGAITITDLRRNNKITIKGNTDAYIVELDGLNSLLLKRAAAYLISLVEVHAKQVSDLSNIFEGIF